MDWMAGDTRMTRTVLLLAILLFIGSSTVEAWVKKSKDVYSREGRSYNSDYHLKAANGEFSQTTASKPTTKSSSGGIGAWGYVAIILTIIFTGMGVYYFMLFYPILCKKERKYDVMEMGSVQEGSLNSTNSVK